MASYFNAIQSSTIDVHEARVLDSVFIETWTKMSGNNIGVFLQTLIEELNELWHVGIEIYDKECYKCEQL